MLADFAQTSNELYCTTNNPWDLSRTPGGSSGGGAAALAAGMSFLNYGSDLVGSIRSPANFCGVYAGASRRGCLIGRTASGLPVAAQIIGLPTRTERRSRWPSCLATSSEDDEQPPP